MRTKTLYFTTGVELQWSGQVSGLEGVEDSMFDLCSYVWPGECVGRLRRLVRRLQHGFPSRPMCQANRAGTEELIEHLRPLLDLQDAEAAQYFLGSVVLHQLGYEPELSMNFEWIPRG